MTIPRIIKNVRIQQAAAFAATAGILIALPAQAFAMHISEGILPAFWAVLWYAVAIPFVALGLRELRRRSEAFP